MFLELLSCARIARKDVVKHLEMIAEDKKQTLSDETTFASKFTPYSSMKKMRWQLRRARGTEIRPLLSSEEHDECVRDCWICQ